MSAKMIAGAGVAVLALAAAAWSASSSLGPRREVKSATAGWNQRDRGPGPGGPAGPGSQAPGGRFEQDVPGPAGGEPMVERRGGPGEPPDDQGPRPAWVTPIAPPAAGWSFLPVADASAAGESVDVGARSLEDLVTGSTVLGALGGASKLGLVQSWKTFVRPLLTRDPAAFAAAVGQLGGIVANATAEADAGAEAPPDPTRELYDRLSALLGESSVDWNAASTRLADPRDRMDVPGLAGLPAGMDFQGRIPMMVMVMREETEQGTTDRRAVSVPLQTLFPAAAEAAEAGAPTVELWTPAAIRAGDRSAPDAGVAVFMAWNASSGVWAPIAMRITLETEVAQQAFQDARGG